MGQPVARVGLAVAEGSRPHLSGDDPWVGRDLHNRYRVLRRLSEGGMGVVYVAEQLSGGPDVAIKVLAPEFADHEDVLRRFHAEAAAIARLQHPHVVELIEFGHTEDGAPFLVMELLSGESLAELLGRQGAVSLVETSTIATQIAAGLRAVHGCGIVHRDLKPENVMLVDGHGERFVKLLDFGISKDIGRGDRITHHEAVLGTPDYMSPEQARGNNDQLDGRADQYALAALVYEMLAGTPPFSGDNPVSVLYQVVHEQPQPVSERAPWIPPDVQPILARALSKNAADRFDCVTEFAAELAALAAEHYDADERSSHTRLRCSDRCGPRNSDGVATSSSQTPYVTPRPLSPVATRQCAPQPPTSCVVQLEDLLSIVRDAVTAGQVLPFAITTALKQISSSTQAALEHRFGSLTRRLEYVGPISKAKTVEAAYLLSRLEPGMTLREAVDVSGMPETQALALLSMLLRSGSLG